MRLPRGTSSWPWVALLFGAVALSYLPSLEGPFFSDDIRYLTANETLKSVRLSELYRPFSETMPHGEYLPLRDVVLRLQFEVFGTNPLGYHVVSLALLGLCIVLVWRLAFQLSLAADEDENQAALIAGLTSAFFAFHPANVEAVAWMASQKDLLAAAFILLSLLALAKALEADVLHPGLLLGAWVSLAAALFSKPSALATPLAATLVVLLFRRDLRGRLVTIAVSVVPMVAVAGLSLTVGLSKYEQAEHTVTEGLSLADKLGRALLILGTQTRIALFPLKLRLTYDVLDPSSLILSSLLGVLTLGVAVMALVILWKRRSLAAFGIAWFPVFLVPYLHFKSLPTWSFAAERYLLLPLFGLALIAATMPSRFLKESSSPTQKRLMVSLITFVLLSGISLSFLRAREWRTTRGLLVANSRVAPDFHYSRYLEIDDFLLQDKNYDRALEAAEQIRDSAARECLVLWIESSRLASTVTEESKLAPAIESATLLESKGRDLYRSSERRDIPRMLLASMLTKRAMDLQESLRQLATRNALIIYNNGLEAMKAQHLGTAEQQFKRAIEIGYLEGEDLARVWNELGSLLQAQGRSLEAEDSYLKALAADPMEWKAALNLLLLPNLDKRRIPRAQLLVELEVRASRAGLEDKEIADLRHRVIAN